MRHISVVLLLIAAFAGLPAQGVAQRALKDHRFWAVPRVNTQRASVWRLPGVASARLIRPSVWLTVLSVPRPSLPRTQRLRIVAQAAVGAPRGQCEPRRLR